MGGAKPVQPRACGVQIGCSERRRRVHVDVLARVLGQQS